MGQATHRKREIAHQLRKRHRRQAWTIGTPIALWFCMMDRKTQIGALNPSTNQAFPNIRTTSFPTRERLIRGFFCLQNIQLVRNHRQDPHFGKAVEERIVWRELLELELQDVDEQIERVSGVSESKP